MKLKVGILSLYFNNYNYGGILQAFALNKVIKDLGYECEQISFDLDESIHYKRRIKSFYKSPFNQKKELIRKNLNKFISKIQNKVFNGKNNNTYNRKKNLIFLSKK